MISLASGQFTIATWPPTPNGIAVQWSIFEDLAKCHKHFKHFLDSSQAWHRVIELVLDRILSNNADSHVNHNTQQAADTPFVLFDLERLRGEASHLPKILVSKDCSVDESGIRKYLKFLQREWKKGDARRRIINQTGDEAPLPAIYAAIVLALVSEQGIGDAILRDVYTVRGEHRLDANKRKISGDIARYCFVARQGFLVYVWGGSVRSIHFPKSATAKDSDYTLYRNAWERARNKTLLKKHFDHETDTWIEMSDIAPPIWISPANWLGECPNPHPTPPPNELSNRVRQVRL